MKSSLCLIHKKRIASLGIVGSMLAIAPLWLMVALANQTAQAQVSADVSNAATSPAPSPSDWTQFHRDNMQRWNPFETVLGVSNVGTLGLKWQIPLGVPSSDFVLESSPAVANGVVYVGSVEGIVYALNASTGAKLWTFATGGDVESSPAVANGVVYVGSDDGNLYALNASSGAKLWSFVTGITENPLTSSPSVVNGVVYVGAGDDLVALNAGTGSRLWSFAVGSVLESSPAVANGVVYMGSTEGIVYALNASTGARLWSFDTDSAGENGIFSSAAVANGVVYVGSNNGNVYALNASTGVKLWSYIAAKPNFQVLSSPAVANGVVYFGSFDGNVYALNASTGALLWSFPADTLSSPAVANGVVYIESGDKLYALNASTGAYLWSYSSGGFGQSSPAIVDGVAYISSLNQVLAFGPGAPADLFLRIEPTPTTVHQGDLITYAFPVWNLGPGNGVQEVLNTQVPAGTTFDYVRISGTPGLGACTTPKFQGTGQIICHENSSMAPNTTWTVRMTVKVTAPSGTVITENAATIGDTTDPNPANNTATVSIKVQ
jgi:outer membrane protein assembly factor BamB